MLKLGDQNNKYFHQIAQTPISHNSIRAIKSEEGSILDTIEEMKSEDIGYFLRMLGAKNREVRNQGESLCHLIEHYLNDSQKLALWKLLRHYKKLRQRCSLWMEIKRQVPMASPLTSSRIHVIVQDTRFNKQFNFSFKLVRCLDKSTLQFSLITKKREQ